MDFRRRGFSLARRNPLLDGWVLFILRHLRYHRLREVTKMLGIWSMLLRVKLHEWRWEWAWATQVYLELFLTVTEKSFSGSSKVVGTDVFREAKASEVDVVVDHRVFLRLHGLRPNNASNIVQINKNPAMRRSWKELLSVDLGVVVTVVVLRRRRGNVPELVCFCPADTVITHLNLEKDKVILSYSSSRQKLQSQTDYIFKISS